jgi:protein-disulfide isomerase
MDRRFLTILGVIVVIIIGAFVISSKSSDSSGGTSSSAQPTNHVEGKGQKGVKLVEYGDYECPICEIYFQPMKQVEAQFDNDITFQFRNLPLVSIHPNAFAAARAAEAASLQGKFWEMHDMLYQNQSDWVQSQSVQTIFTGYAKTLGLNVSKFNSDYASSKVNDAINADLNAFAKTGQDMATPTFYLDGKYLPNAELADAQTGQPSIDKISQVLNNAIAAKAKNNQ